MLMPKKKVKMPKKEEKVLTGGRIDVGDVSKKADLASLVSDLVCAERHLYRTIGKLKGEKKGKYMYVAKVIREMRARKLKRLVKNKDPEVWCLSKHLISGFQEEEEVGIKEVATGNLNPAKEDFKDAWELLKLFFFIQEIG